ncbi:uncharacterized protein LOC110043488 isoform X2 [Orbicella faveolata]|uniref:uncharacterized protein LOC110043488 isoform X2 n=1 Tax=Orbicella faveolata TaxID=48498 RepID=UPI0009E2F592|nr:uncharacterized protein LOC110043488 isoform X2 [Orbicella faveolata]
MYIYDLLIFVGCLVLYVQCKTICKKDQYTVLNSDGSFKRCLNCLTCHPGRGLDPPCGSHIQDPPNPDCVACPAGKFSDELDSAPCHSCQKCVAYEIITAPCTNRSNRICSGTCEAGYFYSKKDSTHSCQKCSYCCFDGKDEEISECANQGLKASKQYCRPRPDKDCSPGSSVISPTIHTTGTEASRNGSSISGGVIGGVIGGVGFIFVVVITLCLWWLHRKKTRGVSGDGKTGFKKRRTSLISIKAEELAMAMRKLSDRSNPLIEEETDESQEAMKIIEEPSSQKIKEGSKVKLVFKCKARGNSKLTYQWYKDGVVLQGKKEGTLVLKSVTLRDFGFYKCVASCEDSSSVRVESFSAELDVIPLDGTTYKCLKDVDLDTQDQIEDFLTQKSFGSGGWRQIAFKYEMDQLKIKSLENDPEPGKKTLEYLRTSNPDLKVYDFCKTLKEHNIRRLDIVKELLGHLSVPSSSTAHF